MSASIFVRSLAVALCISSIAVTPARAGWLDDLALEAKLTEGCEVAYVSHVVERMVGDVQIILAKVHCQDKRVFDASRQDQLSPFRLRRCDAEAAPQPC